MGVNDILDNVNFTEGEVDEYDVDQYEQQLGKMQKLEQARQKREAQRGLAKAGKDVNEAVAKGLKERGISLAQWGQVLKNNPDRAQELYGQILNTHAGDFIDQLVAPEGKARDPKTGKFAKKPARPVEGPSGERASVDDVLEALLPDDDPLFRF